VRTIFQYIKFLNSSFVKWCITLLQHKVKCVFCKSFPNNLSLWVGGVILYTASSYIPVNVTYVGRSVLLAMFAPSFMKSYESVET